LYRLRSFWASHSTREGMRTTHGNASPTVVAPAASVGNGCPRHAVVLSTWSCLSATQPSIACDGDALALAITIAAPLAADRVRRCSPVVLRRLGDADGKAVAHPPPSPAPSALSVSGPSKGCNDYLNQSCGSGVVWGGKPDWSKLQDRDALVRRIAELEALFDASMQRETFLSNKVESARELLECSICFLPLCWPVSLRCSHTFCSACVAKWEMSAASVSKPLTCPVCRAPGGQPTPARALNDVCRVMEDEETAARRKEDVGAYQKYEAALRARIRMESRTYDVREEFVPITLRPEPQAVLTALGLSRSAAGMVAAQADAVGTQSESRESSARGLPTPAPTTINVRTEGAEIASNGFAGAHGHLQTPSSNVTNVRAEDAARVHTPRGRAAHRTTLSNFMEAERS